MDQKVVAYKPYFFREINTTAGGSEHQERIFNLDEFHTFRCRGSDVSAYIYSGGGGDFKSDTIARCNNEDGARYVMDCIMARQTVTEELVISAEEGYDETKTYI